MVCVQCVTKEDERKQRRRASNRRAAERYRQKQKATVDDFKAVRLFAYCSKLMLLLFFRPLSCRERFLRMQILFFTNFKQSRNQNFGSGGV